MSTVHINSIVSCLPERLHGRFKTALRHNLLPQDVRGMVGWDTIIDALEDDLGYTRGQLKALGIVPGTGKVSTKGFFA